jgi:Holliday junction resolvase RusA-like endonuclease
MTLPHGIKTGHASKLPGDYRPQGVEPPVAQKKRRTSAEWLTCYLATPPAPEQSAVERQQQRDLFARHDAVVLSIRLPLAPSANNLKSIQTLPGHRPFLVPSTQYKAYKKAVATFWQRHFQGWTPGPLTGRLRLTILVHQARNGGDIANREKALCDSLSECGAWLDDVQIDDLHLIRGDVLPPYGAIDLTIETIS